MTSTDLAVRTAVSELAIAHDQTRFHDAQVAALRQLGVENAPQGDLDMFFHQAKRTGLDPFAKQIYMIGRNTKVVEWVNGRKVERWVVKYTIQTGIDGYRVLGNRLADDRADEIEQDEALWCGKDGRWVDIWLDDETPPAAAKFVLRKNGKPYIAKVMYAEYVQTNSDGSPNSTWKKRPAGQLAKCAEALAWRMAYPQDFSGMQLEDAVQVIDPDGSPVQPARVQSERVSAADILSAKTRNAAEHRIVLEPYHVSASDPVEKPETVQVEPPAPDEPDAAPAEEMATAEQIKILGDALKAHGLRTRKKQLDYLTEQFKRGFTVPEELTAWECSALTEYLHERQNAEKTTPPPDERAAAEQLPVDGAEGGAR